MAKKKQGNTSNPETLQRQRQFQILFGGFLLLVAAVLTLAFTSYLTNWKVDQSTLDALANREVVAENIFRKIGAWVSHLIISEGIGLAAYVLVLLLFQTGLTFFLNRAKHPLWSTWAWGFVYILGLALGLSFVAGQEPYWGGTLGIELFAFLSDYIGTLGIVVLLVFLVLCVLIFQFKLTPEHLLQRFQKKETQTPEEEATAADYDNNSTVATAEETPVAEAPQPMDPPIEMELSSPAESADTAPAQREESEVQMEVKAAENEETLEDNLAQQLVEKHGFFDPTLELSKFSFPTLELLKDYGEGNITINQEELERNKNKIVSTLENYKIGIAQIKATIGPTVTLYEIVPQAGIRISKIKNLEDDIALSLSALGIRIIAPIPGKGTIGIEVPNQSASIVSMRSVIASPKFQKAEMELPIALGKTISNETFVVDLAKMPHLLMAGATGQGKSVGINALLTSLLYKKHPAEVKFVLVDPKKVELTIYNKIERHYLAKLPDTEDAIITDTNKVINTLNSLCIEMDNRYDLLKNALCRNIKEYNKKFKGRKLNPEEGHQFLPYIVLVIDEFADLIMTAGKEIETPIARLAQLARAVGIHLIIATQRPSVNVITGIIKANFPARIAFRVTSKIDSRTILDSGGADQLIGRGDLLYTQGNDLVRIQCAFVDTPEVDEIANYIGSQTGYASAHQLPEYVGEGEGSTLDVDPSDRDALFREAAEVIVTAQQGSASLLQRKLKLGYNRAGRIIDQMEAAGIVGPFEGSKARQVLVPDLNALEQLLNQE